MKSKGILVFAKNNEKIDYVKQAVFLAKRAKELLDLPVSIVTDSIDYCEEISNNAFDKIIAVDSRMPTDHIKTYHDGSLSKYYLKFQNKGRSSAYDLSPYDETLLLDTDVIICNNNFKKCFDSNYDFQIYKNSVDLAFWRDNFEFKYISEATIDFYWATCIFFRKNEENRMFFELVKHIEDNWHHYRAIYQTQKLFRNDFVFSIAIHIMNGFQKGDFAASLPGTLYHTLDKDILLKIDKSNLTLLVEKKDYIGEYTALQTKDINVHVMNKFSLTRLLDEELSNE